MAIGWYRLDAEHRPVRCSMIEATMALEATRRVALTDLPGGGFVSTVFLALDHRHHGAGPPLLFETMVFSAAGAGGDCWRYSSWDDALAGHAATVKRLTLAAATSARGSGDGQG